MSDPQTVRSLLLCAPPAKRLDLAIASVLFDVRKEYLELVLAGRRQVTPVYLFFDQKRDYDAFFFSPDLFLWPPGRAGKPAPDQVRPYTTDLACAEAVQEFVQFSQITYAQGDLRVLVSDGTTRWEERATIASYEYRRETSRLLALATLHVYAPEFIPLLDVPQQQEAVDALSVPLSLRLIQEPVLVPVFLPPLMYEDGRCQYQVYDVRSQTWSFCPQDWKEDEHACCPGQCPACGAYYCELHTSETAYPFEATREERRVWGRTQVTLKVCVTCALLSEDQVRQLRAVRLALAGEPQPTEAGNAL